jgi:hypothetical protein
MPEPERSAVNSCGDSMLPFPASALGAAFIERRLGGRHIQVLTHAIETAQPSAAGGILL